MVVFTQHDAELGREAAEEQMCEEDVRLLTAWASFQHGGEELGRAPGAEGLHLEQLVNLLVVSELVSLEQPRLELFVGSEERRDFNEIQNPTNALLVECSHQLVEFRLLAGDAMSTEVALRQSKPAGWLVAPEGRQFDVEETRWRVKLDEIFLLLSHVEKITNLTIS